MSPFRLLILASENEAIQNLVGGLTYRGFSCALIQQADNLTNDKTTDLLLIETGNGIPDAAITDITQRIKQNWHVPIVLLSGKEALREVEGNQNIDDFVLRPYNLEELSSRIRRLLKKTAPREESPDLIKAGDVVVDIPKCEVWVKGKIVDLTFTEYELLKLLVSKKGQVLTREVLLNKIWGYDYFGGDRTVDVHITRLRNKIEDTTHNVIETVRNIGYRIK